MKNDSKLLIHISGLQYNANINNDDNMHTDLHIPQSNYAKSNPTGTCKERNSAIVVAQLAYTSLKRNMSELKY